MFDKYSQIVQSLNIKYTSHMESLHQPKPSSPSVLSLGFRLFRRAAFPLTSAIESCWKRWRVTVISSSPVCRASALPSFLISLTADLCQAPRLSTASGRKTIPYRLQACQDLSNLRLWATFSSCPGVSAAWATSAA